MNLKSVISTSALFSLTMIITIFNVAKASEKTIANVTSDNSKTSYQLVIDSNDGRSIKTFYKDVYVSGKKIRREALDAQVMIKTGMILEQRDKYIVMKLKSNDFDLDQGGIVTVDTLYNGASGERRGYEIQIAQSKNGWSLFKQGKAISQIIIQTNRVMILGEVGIKNLVMK